MLLNSYHLFVVQLSSHVHLFVTPWTAACQGFPLCHYLPEHAQTHVHWVSDTIQPSHPLLTPSPPDLSLSQHQGLFQWVSSSNQVVKVLQASTSVLPIQGWFPLILTGLFLLSKGLSRVLSSTTVWKNHFFGAQLSLWSNSPFHTWLLEKT